MPLCFRLFMIQVRHQRTCREARAPKELSSARLCDPPEAQHFRRGLSSAAEMLKISDGRFIIEALDVFRDTGRNEEEL